MKSFIEAILFSARSHSGQHRKDGHTPYINHPLEVMQLVSSATGDGDILIAAVLHDVVEDTPVTGNEIAERFGPRIARIVIELTDDKFLPKEERKRQQLLTSGQLSKEARLIRICDKICNVHDILYAPPRDWPVSRRKDYLEWANAVVNKIRGTHEELEKRFDELYREGVKFLDK
ncbi:MAG TPA: HD domain-containing protein [Bacteroidia bacterium]|nr:HD domain-containing protein [Bacteroidia bacterium]